MFFNKDLVFLNPLLKNLPVYRMSQQMLKQIFPDLKNESNCSCLDFLVP
ncbi:unnamed protein product [Tenebrio molitor]|nr:unnamed protein product [Tenebrio molitor]